MDWTDLLIVGISIGTLLLALWVYCKHDKKIKTLEQKKLEREALENKRAHFDVQYSWLFVQHYLCIQNIGKSTAKDIIISIERNEPLTFQDGTLQYHIDQLEVAEKVSISLVGGFKHDIKVKLTWDDESGREVTQTAFVEDESGNEFMGK